jgi:hypothetical protein
MVLLVLMMPIAWNRGRLARRDNGEKPTGVLTVEDVFDLSELTPGLERRGIRITEMR